MSDPDDSKALQELADARAYLTLLLHSDTDPAELERIRAEKGPVLTTGLAGVAVGMLVWIAEGNRVTPVEALQDLALLTEIGGGDP